MNEMPKIVEYPSVEAPKYPDVQKSYLFKIANFLIDGQKLSFDPFIFGVENVNDIRTREGGTISFDMIETENADAKKLFDELVAGNSVSFDIEWYASELKNKTFTDEIVDYKFCSINRSYGSEKSGKLVYTFSFEK